MTTIPTGHMTGMDGTGWAEDGVTPHPAGGYVRVERRPHRTRYVDVAGRKHRLDGPAAEWADGSREWWFNGQLHRLDGPAVELANGTRQWWVDGKRHRLDGPAVEASWRFRIGALARHRLAGWLAVGAATAGRVTESRRFRVSTSAYRHHHDHDR
ncbi:hypothetical protein [Nostocoides vanveenii]|uniref:Uncharacterized protein n=1 Tax=Nostocoides vanveenii TaxID=330835 RepID=A0ABP4WG20_9MICO